MRLLDGKTAIITGAARGIGREIAKKFAGEGANVAYTDVAEDHNFKSLEVELNELGVKGKGYCSDASDFASSQETVKEILKDFERVDILVNNAGITRDNLFMKMSEEEWDLVIKINLKSVFNLTKAVQRSMIKQRSGSIINISSVVGVGGNPGQANYSASKAGIIGFTKTIARELGARNIRCNAIAPGFIVTEMTGKLPEETVKKWIDGIPLKRGGTPEEVAGVAMFLASDLSSYVSGQTICVCGAMQT